MRDIIQKTSTEPAESPQESVHLRQPRRNRRIVFVLLAIVLIGTIVGIAMFWLNDLEIRNRGLKSLGPCSPVCFSPDGNVLLLQTLPEIDEEPEAILWDLEKGKERRRLRNVHLSESTISSDGQLALVDDKYRLILHDVATGRNQKTPVKDLPLYAPMVFSPDGRQLALVQDQLRIWDTATWKEVAAFRLVEGTSAVNVRFSPDGKTIGAAFGHGPVRIWDVSTKKQLSDYPLIQVDVRLLIRALSPDLKTAVIELSLSKSGGANGGGKLWDLTTGHRQDLPWSLAGCHYSQDSKILATGREFEAGPEITLWETSTGRIVSRIPGYREALPSPDGKFLAAQTEDKSIRVIWVR